MTLGLHKCIPMHVQSQCAPLPLPPPSSFSLSCIHTHKHTHTHTHTLISASACLCPTTGITDVHRHAPLLCGCENPDLGLHAYTMSTFSIPSVLFVLFSLLLLFFFFFVCVCVCVCVSFHVGSHYAVSGCLELALYSLLVLSSMTFCFSLTTSL